MADDLVPSADAAKPLSEQAADQDASKQSASNNKQDVASANSDESRNTKSRLIALVDGGIGLVCWMLAEMFARSAHYNTYSVFYWLAIVCFLAGVAYGIALLVAQRKAVLFVYILVCGGLAFLVWQNRLPVPSITPPPTTVAVPQPDYIQGTKFTHKELSDRFPFGYTVFFGDEKRLRYEVFKGRRLNWNVDWDKVKIEPDFRSLSTHWTIPQIVEGDRKWNDNTFKGNGFTIDTPFSVGFAPYKSFWIEGQPSLYVGVLGVDQDIPVYVIGFRIATKDEIYSHAPMPGF